MELKIKVAKMTPDHFVVIVPPEYKNSARNISALAKLMGVDHPAKWDIVYENTLKTITHIQE
jgi:hypothetical protein